MQIIYLPDIGLTGSTHFIEVSHARKRFDCFGSRFTAEAMDKKPYIVPIPGTRKLSRLIENAGAADVSLSSAEVKALDDALNNIATSFIL